MWPRRALNPWMWTGQRFWPALRPSSRSGWFPFQRRRGQRTRSIFRITRCTALTRPRLRRMRSNLSQRAGRLCWAAWWSRRRSWSTTARLLTPRQRTIMSPTAITLKMWPPARSTPPGPRPRSWRTCWLLCPLP